MVIEEDNFAPKLRRVPFFRCFPLSALKKQEEYNALLPVPALPRATMRCLSFLTKRPNLTSYETLQGTSMRFSICC